MQPSPTNTCNQRVHRLRQARHRHSHPTVPHCPHTPGTHPDTNHQLSSHKHPPPPKTTPDPRQHPPQPPPTTNPSRQQAHSGQPAPKQTAPTAAGGGPGPAGSPPRQRTTPFAAGRRDFSSVIGAPAGRCPRSWAANASGRRRRRWCRPRCAWAAPDEPRRTEETWPACGGPSSRESYRGVLIIAGGTWRPARRGHHPPTPSGQRDHGSAPLRGAAANGVSGGHRQIDAFVRFHVPACLLLVGLPDPGTAVR